MDDQIVRTLHLARYDDGVFRPATLGHDFSLEHPDHAELLKQPCHLVTADFGRGPVQVYLSAPDWEWALPGGAKSGWATDPSGR